jgi:hypothetical protein
MYCSIDEAWETSDFFSRNKKIKTSEPIIDNEIEEFKLFKANKKSKNNKYEYEQEYEHEHKDNIEHYTETEDNTINKSNITCDMILNHLDKCDICLKRVYKKYTCLGNHENIINKLITKDNKEVITVILVGFLIILTLQIFKTKE